MANRARLEHLITVLEGVKTAHKPFAMGSWFDSCGTASCALGWACFDPLFAAKGLRRGGVAPSFGDLSGYSAARLFFDIADEQSIDLFSPWAYVPTAPDAITPDMVIAKVRALLDAEAVS